MRSSRVDIDQLYTDVYDLLVRHHHGRAHSTGLIAELRNVADRVLTRGARGEGRPGKPGSRPPSSESNQALDLLALMESAVWELDADLRDQLDAHLSYDRTWTTALAAIPGLVGRLPDPEQHPLAVKTARAVQQWKRTCLVQLRHVAPMTRLDAACSYCGEQSLIVRADASTDVVCVNSECADERGEQPRWTRDTWVLLLNQQEAS